MSRREKTGTVPSAVHDSAVPAAPCAGRSGRSPVFPPSRRARPTEPRRAKVPACAAFTAWILAALATSAFAAASTLQDAPANHRVRRAHYLMGTVFEITAEGPGREQTAAAIEEAFQAIRRADQELSHYRADSGLSRFNRLGERGAVTISADLHSVLAQSIEYGKISLGAFDVTIGPLVRLWRQAAERNRAPTGEELREARNRTGDERIVLLPDSRARFASGGVEVNLGAIGKGWAVDRAREVLARRGIADALISAGTSTLYAMGDDGEAPGSPGWLVGIRDPRGSEHDVLLTLRLRDAALSTSGSYERFHEIGGRRYSHIIDPRTGRPVQSMLSASVVAPGATEADALSTALFVLGLDEGEKLARRLGREAVLTAQDPASGEMLTRHVFRPSKVSHADQR